MRITMAIRDTLLVGLVVLLLGPGSAAADDAAAETIRLWPGDAPGALGTAVHDIPVMAWWQAADGGNGGLPRRWLRRARRP